MERILVVKAVRRIALISYILMVAAAAQGQEAKRFPPYPEVWGYEEPWGATTKPVAGLAAYRMPDGDYLMTWVTDLEKPDEARTYEGLLFFAGSRQRFSGAQYAELVRTRPLAAERGVWADLGFSIADLGNGATLIADYPQCERGCCRPFDGGLERSADRKTEGNPGRSGVSVRRSFLYVTDQPVRLAVDRQCERNRGLRESYIVTRVLSPSVDVLALDDHTVLLNPYGSRVIIRLDRGLKSRSPLLGTRVFLVDAGVIRDLQLDPVTGALRNDQDAADAIWRHIQGLKLGAGN